MRRLSHLLVVLGVVGSLAMSSAPVTSSTVVGEDRCDGSDVVAAEHDACTWTMSTTTVDAGPPVLELRLNTAATGDEVADGALLVWSSGDCAFFLDHDSGVGADDVTGSATTLIVGCGELRTECLEVAGNTVDCERSYENETYVDLDRGVREGRDLVWTLTFEDALAEWAPLHERGSVLDPGLGSVGPRAPVESSQTFAALICGTDTPCTDVGGDFIQGRRAHVVG